MAVMTPNQIRKTRLALGLTATEFAKRIGVSEDCFWKWERGDRHPAYRKMIELNKLANKARKQPA
jgi:DNA-binding transcriptional regulator YiaG